MSKVFYHVSPRIAQKEILEKGLETHSPIGDYPIGVYLFLDLDNANFFAETKRERDEEEYGYGEGDQDIYEVRVDTSSLIDDPAVTDDDDFQSEYPSPLRSKYSEANIPVECVKII